MRKPFVPLVRWVLGGRLWRLPAMAMVGLGLGFIPIVLLFLHPNPWGIYGFEDRFPLAATVLAFMLIGLIVKLPGLIMDSLADLYWWKKTFPGISLLVLLPEVDAASTGQVLLLLREAPEWARAQVPMEEVQRLLRSPSREVRTAALELLAR